MAAGDNYHYLCAETWASCQTGVLVSAPSGVPCTSASDHNHNTTVCVGYDGDYVYVKDRSADTHSALAEIISDAWESDVTFRVCRNSRGANTWVRCNFNWPEDGEKSVAGGYLPYYSGDTVTQTLWTFFND